MSEVDNSVDEAVVLQAAKNKADMLGVTYHPNIKMDKLQAKIQAKLDELPEVDPITSGAVPVLDKGTSRASKRKDAAQLVRVRVTCMDPNKKDWPGELFSVGNSVVGFFKKYVPFGTEWHVPKIIFNHLQSKKCQIFVTIMDSKGNKTKDPRLVGAYNVEVLAPLTPTELAELAKVQQASGRLEDNSELAR